MNFVTINYYRGLLIMDQTSIKINVLKAFNTEKTYMLLFGNNTKETNHFLLEFNLFVDHCRSCARLSPKVWLEYFLAYNNIICAVRLPGLVLMKALIQSNTLVINQLIKEVELSLNVLTKEECFKYCECLDYATSSKEHINKKILPNLITKLTKRIHKLK